MVSTLDNERTAEPLSARLRREIVLAQDAFGFAPTVKVDWSTVPAEVEADAALGDDLVAVLRESLSNVAQHARASHAEIALTVDDERLTLSVTDDGIGPPEAFDRHSGTSNLANRALRRAGSFSLEKANPDASPPGCLLRWTVKWSARA